MPDAVCRHRQLPSAAALAEGVASEKFTARKLERHQLLASVKCLRKGVQAAAANLVKWLTPTFESVLNFFSDLKNTFFNGHVKKSLANV